MVPARCSETASQEEHLMNEVLLLVMVVVLLIIGIECFGAWKGW